MLSVELFRCKHTAIAGDWLGQGQSDGQDGFYGIIIPGDGAHEKKKVCTGPLDTGEGGSSLLLFVSFFCLCSRPENLRGNPWVK